LGAVEGDGNADVARKINDQNKRSVCTLVVIVFLINAATALASIVATVLTLRVVVDSEHRVRTDKIDDRPATIWRARDRAVGSVVDRAKVVGGAVWRRLKRSEGGGALLG
jgi:hypothetical protein